MGEVEPTLLCLGLPATAREWLSADFPQLKHCEITLDELSRCVHTESVAGLLVSTDAPGVTAASLANVLRRTEPTPNPVPTIVCVDRTAARSGLEPWVAAGATRLLLLPLDRRELTQAAAQVFRVAAQPPAATAPPATVATALSALWERYKPDMLARVDALDTAAIEAVSDALTPATRRAAEREAHKLAGAAGTFGFPQASNEAREAEQLLAGDSLLEPKEVRRLADLACSIRERLVQNPAAPLAAPASRGESVLLVDADPASAESFVMEAEGRSLTVTRAGTAGEAKERIAQQLPNAAVIALGDGGNGDLAEQLALVAELSSRVPPIPVLVLGHAGLGARVQANRMGARVYVERPVSAPKMIDLLSDLLQQSRPARTRILAVDDDPQVLATVRALLDPDRFEMIGLSDPLNFWRTLQAAAPDFLILDVDMPYIDGIELCRVTRSDPQWAGVPILFLTARVDASTIHRVFGAGADDYVSKPIIGPELETRIANRVERARLHRERADHDYLTGLPNRRKGATTLDRFLHLAAQTEMPVAVALLDLDHFKQLNDRLGHAAGDSVLKQFAARLRTAFSGEALAARWGGEEFAVFLFNADGRDAAERLETVLGAVRRANLAAVGEDGAPVTFSAGIAVFPKDGADAVTLLTAADQALYAAKAAGRNRIVEANGAATGAAARRTVDIAVVEDDDTLAELLRHALTARGRSIEVIQNGREALQRLGGSSPALRCRVCLLDVDLPEMDGLSVLRTLARDGVTRQTRIIMLTARSGESETLEALKLGAFDHVAKPFSIPILMQRVARALDR